MPAVVNAITMTLTLQPGKEKLLILKTKAHSFHTANISYKNISSQPQFFIFQVFSCLCSAAIVYRNHIFDLYKQNKSSESKVKFRQASNR